jgi:ParB family chromosome partitioning protein
LQQLLAVHGTQEALAARLHRSQGWVSQRLALLGLTPELKEKLVSGEEPAELLRRVGNKKPEEQEAHLERLKDEKRRKASKSAPSPAPTLPAGERETSITPAGARDDHYGVMKEAAASERQTSTSSTASLTAAPPKQAVVPDPRPEPSSKPRQIKMPWTDGAAAMDIAFEKLTQHGQRHAALSRYINLAGGSAGFADDLLASTSAEFRKRLIELLSK